MSQTGSVERLPQKIREEIDRRLIENGFGDYINIAEELRARGYSKISKSGLHRYGLQIKRRVQMGRAQAQLEEAGIDAAMAAELIGEATLVVVIDRRNGRARLLSLPASAAEVIAQIKSKTA